MKQTKKIDEELRRSFENKDTRGMTHVLDPSS